MIRHIEKSQGKRFIIGTEEGMIYRLETLFPDREFAAAGKIVCEDMRYTTPERYFVPWSHHQSAIEIPHCLARRAAAAVRRMTEIS